MRGDRLVTPSLMDGFSARDLDPDENARLIKSVINPRPIAWISTGDENGVENLAPFCSYNYVGSSQPVVVFNAPRVASGRMKDTARNALTTEEFAVNVVTEALIDEMDRTSASLPPEESEFEYADVARAPCREITPPRVADAAVTMECTLYDAIEVYEKLMVLGDVQHYHVSEDVMTAQFARLPWRLLDPLAEKLAALPGIAAVFYDVTHKPLSGTRTAQSRSSLVRGLHCEG